MTPEPSPSPTQLIIPSPGAVTWDIVAQWVAIGILIACTVAVIFFVFNYLPKVKKIKPFYASIAAVAVLGGVFAFLLPVAFNSGFGKDDDGRVLRQLILYTTGGLLGVITLGETHRKNNQEKEKNENDHTRQVYTERRSRYTKAVEQLADENAAVRLGGIYTLVGLVDEWLADDTLESEEQQKEGQVIINNLCSYIRSPFPLAEEIEEYEARKELEKLQKTESEKLSEEESSRLQVLLKRFEDSGEYEKPKDITADYAKFHEEQDVRRAIFVEMSKHSSDIIKEKGTVINTVQVTWSAFDFDFSRAPIFYPLNGLTIEKGNFSDAKFYADTTFFKVTFNSDANFSKATFHSNAYFGEATFHSNAYFGEATFNSNAYFGEATFNSNAYFGEATFNSPVYFRKTTFNSPVYFRKTTFNSPVHFNEANFHSAVYFNEATFNSPVYFNEATFNSTVHFRKTTFHSITYFNKATFHSAIYFNEANFHNAAYFNEETFNSIVFFKEATFNSSAYFREATFNNDAHFGKATFNNIAYFREATFNNIAYFREANFNSDAYFNEATFNSIANFGGVTFNGKSNFNESYFNNITGFVETNFNNDVHFGKATFNNTTHFGLANFIQTADFWQVTFTGNVYFGGAKFSKKADFWSAEFSGDANFNGSYFEKYAPIFAYDSGSARFSDRVNWEDSNFSVYFDSQPIKLGSAELDYGPRTIPHRAVLFSPNSWDEKSKKYTHISDRAK